MIKNIYLLFLGLIICSCTTQTIGLTYPNTTVNSNTNLTNSTTIDQFIITPELQPITLNVNVIILKRDNKGQTNFELNNAEEKKLLGDYFMKINDVWSHFYQPDDLTGCYTGKDFYPDSKIRFQFYFKEIIDAKGWNYLNSGANLNKGNVSGFSPTENWYLSALDQKLAQDPSMPKGIFVYLTMDGERFEELYQSKGKGYDINGVEASQFPTTTNLSRTSAIHVPNRYLKYLSQRYQSTKENNLTWADTRNWFLGDAVGTSHEFGHTLGLSHSNKYHSTNQCSYSLMSQNWKHQRNYLQPTEILLAHKNLRESNLIQFATENSFLGNTFILNENTTWNKTQRFYSNLKIDDNITLQIEDKIILSPQAKIIFGKNSKIILKGKGTITLPNGEPFKNFINKTATSITES